MGILWSVDWGLERWGYCGVLIEVWGYCGLLIEVWRDGDIVEC
jgi:hypothetical protein